MKAQLFIVKRDEGHIIIGDNPPLETAVNVELTFPDGTTPADIIADTESFWFKHFWFTGGEHKGPELVQVVAGAAPTDESDPSWTAMDGEITNLHLSMEDYEEWQAEQDE